MARRVRTRLVAQLLMAAGLIAAMPVCAAGQDEAQKPGTHPPIDLSPYAGKVVYLDFWASWCAPCKQSFPWMIGLQERLRDDGLAVVTVNVDRDRKAADRFLNQMKSELPVIFDPDGKVAGFYDLEGMPSSYIYARDGTLRSTHIGFHPNKVDEIEVEMKALLSEEAPDARSE